jgi:hypothetical protein
LLIQAYVRGFAVVCAFRPGEDYLSNPEIAERASIPCPTTTGAKTWLASWVLGAPVVTRMALCWRLIAAGLLET